MITSSAPQEGKTTVAINLGASFAQADKKTIILDCDWYNNFSKIGGTSGTDGTQQMISDRYKVSYYYLMGHR